METDALNKSPQAVALEMGAAVVDEPPTGGNVVRLDKRRTSFDLSAQTKREIKCLTHHFGGNASRVEIIRNSLLVYWTLSSLEDDTVAIIIRDPEAPYGNQDTIFSPALRAANSLLRASKHDARTKITLELPARAMRMLEQLRERTGETTKADVIRQAIHVHWVLRTQIASGRKVIVQRNGPGGIREECELFDLGSGIAPEADHDEDDTQSKRQASAGN